VHASNNDALMLMVGGGGGGAGYLHDTNVHAMASLMSPSAPPYSKNRPTPSKKLFGLSNSPDV
jgi:hypothetical protein